MLIVAVDGLDPSLNEPALRDALADITDASLSVDPETRSIHIDESTDRVPQLVLGLENAGFKVKSMLIE